MRYLQRNIDTELISWSKDKYMKPLLLRGARQVGKTSAVRHLAENFEYYVEIDLNTRQDLHPLMIPFVFPSSTKGNEGKVWGNVGVWEKMENVL